MNEPACFNNTEGTMLKSNIQTASLVGHSDTQVEHREVHSVYGYFNTLATSEGLLKRT